jgi:AhpD family alkylhydroperoxidase
MSAISEKLAKINKGYLFAKKNLPEAMVPYFTFSAMAKKAGALSEKEKEIIALGIAMTVRCGGCLLYHMKECKKLGVTREEIMETFGVAVKMGGGPVLTSATEVEEALEEFYPVVPEKKEK